MDPSRPTSRDCAGASQSALATVAWPRAAETLATLVPTGPGYELLVQRATTRRHPGGGPRAAAELHPHAGSTRWLPVAARARTACLRDRARDRPTDTRCGAAPLRGATHGAAAQGARRLFQSSQPIGRDPWPALAPPGDGAEAARPRAGPDAQSRGAAGAARPRRAAGGPRAASRDRTAAGGGGDPRHPGAQRPEAERLVPLHRALSRRPHSAPNPPPPAPSPGAKPPTSGAEEML